MKTLLTTVLTLMVLAGCEYQGTAVNEAASTVASAVASAPLPDIASTPAASATNHEVDIDKPLEKLTIEELPFKPSKENGEKCSTNSDGHLCRMVSDWCVLNGNAAVYSDACDAFQEAMWTAPNTTEPVPEANIPEPKDTNLKDYSKPIKGLEVGPEGTLVDWDAYTGGLCNKHNTVACKKTKAVCEKNDALALAASCEAFLHAYETGGKKTDKFDADLVKHNPTNDDVDPILPKLVPSAKIAEKCYGKNTTLCNEVYDFCHMVEKNNFKVTGVPKDHIKKCQVFLDASEEWAVTH